VNVLIGFLIVLAAAAIAIVAMLLVRRRAPDGGYFNDGDRAAGVFGVLATGFSVLLGFLIFLAFTSYDNARTGAETEALTVAQQVRTAQSFAPALRDELVGELVCYARSVTFVEWPQMKAGTQGEQLNPWGFDLFTTLQTIEPSSNSEQSAYDHWLDQTSDREVARNARIHGAVGIIPSPLWFALFFASAIILVFMLFFADSGERAVVQGLLIGSVVAVLVTLLLLLRFLDNPIQEGIGGLEPNAMERTIVILDEIFQATGRTVELPCDANGVALG
jgi:hypothetical protein